MDKNIINMEEMLKMLGISQRRLKIIINNDKFPAIKLGGKYVFLSKSVLEWLSNNEIKD